MKSDLYRLNQKYRGAPTKKSAYAKGGSQRIQQMICCL